jgi:hypothetical protein
MLASTPTSPSAQRGLQPANRCPPVLRRRCTVRTVGRGDRPVSPDRVSANPSTYRELAERAWAWVLTLVRQDDVGVWLAEQPGQTERGEFPYGMHSGIGGLAHAMDEIRLVRPLADGEVALGEEIQETLVRRIEDETAVDYFDGLTSTIGALIASKGGGAELAVARLQELAAEDGWPAPWIGPPRAVAGGRCNDATLGTASVLLGAVWAHREHVPVA